MSSPDYFGPLFNPSTAEELAAMDEARFEDDVVHYVLASCQLYDVKRDMLRQSQEEYGRPQLTLAALYDRFSFPLRLQAVKITGIAEDMPLHRIYERIVQLKAWRRWQAMLEETDDDGPSGLVFHYPYLKSHRLRDGRGGALVLHNCQDCDSDVPGVRITYRTAERPEVSIHLEPFTRLLAVLIGNGWRPE